MQDNYLRLFMFSNTDFAIAGMTLDLSYLDQYPDKNIELITSFVSVMYLMNLEFKGSTFKSGYIVSSTNGENQVLYSKINNFIISESSNSLFQAFSSQSDTVESNTFTNVSSIFTSSDCAFNSTFNSLTID